MKSDGILHVWSMSSATQHVGNASEGCKALPEPTTELAKTGKKSPLMNYKLKAGKTLLWSFGTLRGFEGFGFLCSVFLGALGSNGVKDLKIRSQTLDQNLRQWRRKQDCKQAFKVCVGPSIPLFLSIT